MAIADYTRPSTTPTSTGRVSLSLVPQRIEMLFLSATGERYVAVLEPELDRRFPGYYNGRVVGLPGCVSYGENISNATANLRNAFELYLEDPSI